MLILSLGQRHTCTDYVDLQDVHFHFFSDSKDHDKADMCPDFSKYLYFLFAPTLIYRDNYPRYVFTKIIKEDILEK